jgi:glycosyltransferase involved in cell wall biosynthesis
MQGDELSAADLRHAPAPAMNPWAERDGPKRIAIVTNGLTVGGAEKQLVGLALSLKQRGDEVALISILPSAAHEELLSAAGIPITVLPLRRGARGLSAILAGTRVLRSFRPDVLVCFVYQAMVLGRIAGRCSGVPTIISSIRNERFGGRSRELVVRLTDRLGSVTTTNSAEAGRNLIGRRIVPARRLMIIPNGIDLSLYQRSEPSRRQLRRELGVSEAGFLWLAVGSLTKQKDYPTLLTAMTRTEPSRLCIAGDGPLRPELEQRVAGLGLGERVSFLGVRHDIPSMLSAADGLVLSSSYEGSPNAVLEALAAELPVVATRVGGNAELVEDGVSGFLVAPGDPLALAAAMQRLMRCSRHERQAMGLRGRAHIQAEHDLSDVHRRWHELIDRASIGRRAATRHQGAGAASQ